VTVKQVYEQQLAPILRARGKAKHRTRRTAAGFSSTTGQHYRAVFDAETGALDFTILTGHVKRGAASQRGPVTELDETLPEDINWRVIDE